MVEVIGDLVFKLLSFVWRLLGFITVILIQILTKYDILPSKAGDFCDTWIKFWHKSLLHIWVKGLLVGYTSNRPFIIPRSPFLFLSRNPSTRWKLLLLFYFWSKHFNLLFCRLFRSFRTKSCYLKFTKLFCEGLLLFFHLLFQLVYFCFKILFKRWAYFTDYFFLIKLRTLNSKSKFSIRSWTWLYILIRLIIIGIKITSQWHHRIEGKI